MDNIQRKALVSKLLKVINLNQPVKGTYIKSIKPEDIFDTETPTTTLYPVKVGNSNILVPLVNPNEQAKPAINPDLALKIISKVSDPKQKDILKNYIIQTQIQEEKQNVQATGIQEVKIKEDVLKKTKESELQKEIKKKEFEKDILTPEQKKEAIEKEKARQKEIKETKLKNLEKANLTSRALKGAEEKEMEDLINDIISQIYKENKDKLKNVKMKEVLTMEQLNEKYPQQKRAALYKQFDTDLEKAIKEKDTKKLQELKQSDIFRLYEINAKKNQARKELVNKLINL